ncbi:GNAT family N-acetyltransferase [Pseudonocardia sp. TRM90224]|uniref:GNAT family N-acetyltransferase n=1 Tax=Pseudonocardia sp. TRM90224 TaxID=2812678 RepID=UPI001E4813A3|nr:GNAT family N-acetyltransferase [Pseudonocardia sp. TRM90224]
MHLRAMTHDEFDRFLANQAIDYGTLKARAGVFDEATAEQQARSELLELLPDGSSTAGMLFFTAVEDGANENGTDENGTDVGWLWLAMPAPGRRQPWVYDLWVDPEHRRKGYGRAIMLAAEREVAARGHKELGLNVFGDNTYAIALYASLGYHVTAMQMVKPLVP